MYWQIPGYKSIKVNSKEISGISFSKVLEDLFINRMDANTEITAKFLDETKFRDAVTKHLTKYVWGRIRESG